MLPGGPCTQSVEDLMMATGSESSSAAAASHYSANARLIATYAGVTMVAPPGRAARADHLVLFTPRVLPFPQSS